MKLLDTDYLVLTLYGEARGEPMDGKIAVANVIINRFNTGKWGSIKEVVLAPKQFSCWNKFDPNYPILKALSETEGWSNKQPFKELIWVARGVIENILQNTVEGREYYMTTKLFRTNRPGWADNAKDLKIIGTQTFFAL